MAIFVYDKETKKWVESKARPLNADNTRNHVNMRTTWSNQTKMEFNTTTIEDSVSKMGGDI